VAVGFSDESEAAEAVTGAEMLPAATTTPTTDTNQRFDMRFPFDRRCRRVPGLYNFAQNCKSRRRCGPRTKGRG
jgi:hypothetical protein